MRTCPICGLVTEEDTCPEGHGPTFAEEVDPLTGKVFAGRYRVLTRLGAGGMGAVYRATQLGVERDVALKVMHEHLQTADAIARFHREMQITARVDHPNCVRVLDFGHTEDKAMFFAMELVSGESLQSVLEREGTLPEGRATTIARQILLALGAVHAQRLVHRDLKPDNVMLTKVFGQLDFVKVLDFGIARAISSGTGDTHTKLTKTGGILGTPLYMSPEQASGKNLDQRSDLYSVGVILFRMLIGEAPFAGTDPITTLVRHVSEAPLPIAEARRKRGLPPVSPDLASLVDDLLAKDPDARPQSVEAVLERLTGAPPPALMAGSRGDAAVAVPRPLTTNDIAPTSLRRKRWPLLIGAGVVAAAVVLAIAAGSNGGGQPPDHPEDPSASSRNEPEPGLVATPDPTEKKIATAPRDDSNEVKRALVSEPPAVGAEAKTEAKPETPLAPEPKIETEPATPLAPKHEPEPIVEASRAAPAPPKEEPAHPQPAASTLSGTDLYKKARALHNSDPEGAFELYKQAADRGYSAAWKMIGSLEVRRGNTSGAISAYKRYLALNPAARDHDIVREIIVRLGGTP